MSDKTEKLINDLEEQIKNYEKNGEINVEKLREAQQAIRSFGASEPSQSW